MLSAGLWRKCIGTQLPLKVLASHGNPSPPLLPAPSSSFDFVSGSPGFQTHQEPEGDLEFLIFLSLPSKCFDCRHV